MEKRSTTTTKTTPPAPQERPDALQTLGSPDPTRLSPPRSSGKILARERLQSQLIDARRRRCIVLKGPAGCGKTTVVNAWRQALLPLGFEIAWLSLISEDNRLPRFLDYLLASLGQVDPALVSSALQLHVDSGDNEAAERILIALVRDIAQYPHQLVLVLDDLHALSDASIHQSLQWLLDHAPANLHLVLVTRSGVPLSLARLRSQQLTLELEWSDLRFTQDEASRFLEGQLGEISLADAQLIHDMTDGWITGLQLVAVTRRKGRQRQAEQEPVSLASMAKARLRDNQAFTRFFEAEVLALLPPQDLELLQHLSVCNRFCASLCAALLGRPDAAVQATALFRHLEDENLFLVAVEGGEGEAWFRFHPLLRETLLRLFATRSIDEQRAVHERAWHWYRDRGQLGEAVRHAIQADQAVAAATLVEQSIEVLYAHGNLRQLIELIQLLPLEQLRSSIALRQQLVRMQLSTGDLAACEQNLEQLERDVPPDDEESRFRLSLLRVVLAVQRDDIESAMALLPQLLTLPGNADAVMTGARANLLSWLYMHRGEYELARRIQLDRPTILLANGTPLLGTTAGILQGRCLIGLSLAMEGQMNQAERIYREVLYEAQQVGRSCSEARYLATALLGEVLYQTNEVEAAFELLKDKVELFERSSIPDSVMRALVVLGKCQWRMGNHREAFAYLEWLDGYAKKYALDRVHACSLGWQVHWHLHMGELVAAEANLAQVEAIAARLEHSGRSGQGEIQIFSQGARVRWLVNQGDRQLASQQLDKVIALCETHNRQLGVVYLTMLSAVLDEQRNLTESAQEKVIFALRSGHRFGLVRSLLDAHVEALDLITRVAQRGVLDPVLAFYVERLQAAGRVTWVTEPQSTKADESGWQLAPGMQPLNERELEILKLLAQALTNKKIGRALGLSHETVKWYLRHIYSKLGVGSRDEAVARLLDFEAGKK
ncbi:LuxR C-terminal-related transcriptional regulator [Pseudomonas sp. NPDC089569]|uniref:LuxR C-terminal-related transcriptional regulator n=1 Tax=Pseudomonas sp. NPDC089569 TaxID=3390722 RepID=UPI003D01A7DB